MKEFVEIEGRRCTPPQAEAMAGKASSKAWAKTLRVMHNGESIPIGQFMTSVLGVKKRKEPVSKGKSSRDIQETRSKRTQQVRSAPSR